MKKIKILLFIDISNSFSWIFLYKQKKENTKIRYQKYFELLNEKICISWDRKTFLAVANDSISSKGIVKKLFYQDQQ